MFCARSVYIYMDLGNLRQKETSGRYDWRQTGVWGNLRQARQLKIFLNFDETWEEDKEKEGDFFTSVD